MILSYICRTITKFTVTFSFFLSLSLSLSLFSGATFIFHLGFTISLFEYEATIPTLWKTTKRTFLPPGEMRNTDKTKTEFMSDHPELVHDNNAMNFLSADGGETYNRCHCTFDRLFVAATH